ncbi:MAG: hypothetical protein QM757_40420 [Paludibaculum sp.]
MRAMANLRLFLAITLLVCVGLRAEPPDQPRVLSVCEVLKNVERLNNRMVTIRGVVGWGFRHGLHNIGQEGLDSAELICPAAQGRKRLWIPALQLTSPQNLEAHEGAVSFREKSPTLSDLAGLLRGESIRFGKSEAIVTMTGELKTRKGIRIERHGDDIIGNGFGQAGALSALLVVRTVVAVEDVQTHAPLSFERKDR